MSTKTSLVFKFLKFKKKFQDFNDLNKTAQSTGCEKVTKY